jgi:hypothetical protein
MGVYGMPLKEGGAELGLMPQNGGQGIKGRRGRGKLKGTVLHCKDHKLHGEIDSRNKRCIVAGCGKRASFGTRAPEGQSKKGEGPMFCKSHSRYLAYGLGVRVSGRSHSRYLVFSLFSGILFSGILFSGILFSALALDSLNTKTVACL